MIMKRTMLILFALLLLVPVSLAQESGEALLAQAVALGERMGELAASEAYVAAFTSSDSIGGIIAGWGEGDYSAPAAVWRSTLNADAALSAASMLTNAQQPDAAREELSRRLLSSLPSMANAAAGAEVIAATSIMTAQTAFVCEACDEATIYILTYASGTPVAVTFQPCQDGAVVAQAYFLAVSDSDLQTALGMLSLMGASAFEEVALP